MTEKKYILCRPQGGLNDTLNQVEICRNYAASYGRILLVDGRKSGVLGEFGDYFQMEGDGHIFNTTDPAMPEIETLSCYPAEVRGRIGSIRTRPGITSDWRGPVDAETGVRLVFPLDRDHPEALLLHYQGGGGIKSFALIDRLTLTPSLAQQASAKIAELPEKYSALHIRNTDYRTNIGMVINAIRDQVAGQDLLLCSDDPAAFDVVRSGLPKTRVHQITHPYFDSNRPQHVHGLKADASVRHLIAAASIFDLCALAAADTLFLPVLQSHEAGGNVKANFAGRNLLGGFSQLAAHLCEDKTRLRRLLGAAGARLEPNLQKGKIRVIKTM